MTLRLDAGAAATIAAGHAKAAGTIDESAASSPSGMDAGRGAAQILDILAACSGTAARLAEVNQGIASVVRAVAADFDATEETVAAGFARMGSELR